MAEYYLISQLPSLDGIGDNTPLPITEEAFLELCHRFLGKKTQAEIDGLTLLPSLSSEESTNPLIAAWNNGERNLRLALCRVRAERMNKPYDGKDKNISAELLKIASAATEITNPLEAEQFLLRYRLQFLESLRPMNSFSEDFLFYYGLKLKLIYRIRQFDSELGATEYKKIYDSILAKGVQN